MIETKVILKFVDKILAKEDFKRDFFDAVKEDEDLFATFNENLKKASICIKNDLVYFLECDPAANSEEEIEVAYPGFKAIKYYRIAHILYELGEKIIARVISEKAHHDTGIDIHPGAKIGCPFFIDHGTGVVIGETAEVGNFCRIYQGVTLGALSLGKGSKLKGTKRHPTIGNNVIIYSGASILGGDVVIGNNVTIGSNVFLLESIPDNYKVVLAKPELVLKKKDN